MFMYQRGVFMYRKRMFMYLKKCLPITILKKKKKTIGKFNQYNKTQPKKTKSPPTAETPLEPQTPPQLKTSS